MFHAEGEPNPHSNIKIICVKYNIFGFSRQGELCDWKNHVIKYHKMA